MTIKDMHEQGLMTLEESSGLKVPEGIRISLTKEYAKIIHLEMLLDTNKYFELARFLFYKKWVAVVNKTDIPLWTSDNPVSFSNSFNYEGNLGILSPGVEIRLHLSRFIIIFI